MVADANMQFYHFSLNNFVLLVHVYLVRGKNNFHIFIQSTSFVNRLWFQLSGYETNGEHPLFCFYFPFFFRCKIKR